MLGVWGTMSSKKYDWNERQRGRALWGIDAPTVKALRALPPGQSAWAGAFTKRKWVTKDGEKTAVWSDWQECWLWAVCAGRYDPSLDGHYPGGRRLAHWDHQPEQYRQSGESVAEKRERDERFRERLGRADRELGSARAQQLLHYMERPEVSLEDAKVAVARYCAWLRGFCAPLPLERFEDPVSGHHRIVWQGCLWSTLPSYERLKRDPTFLGYQEALEHARNQRKEARRAPRVRDRKDEQAARQAARWLDANLPKMQAVTTQRKAKMLRDRADVRLGKLSDHWYARHESQWSAAIVAAKERLK
jgi:hypothetical protein